MVPWLQPKKHLSDLFLPDEYLGYHQRGLDGPKLISRFSWYISTYDVRGPGKGGDLLCSLVPSHCSHAIRDCFDKDHCLVSSHPKTASKSFVVKCLASLLIDA